MGQEAILVAIGEWGQPYSRLLNVSKMQQLALFKSNVLPKAKSQLRIAIIENHIPGEHVRFHRLPRLSCYQRSH
jgi:hypothetical protein